MISPVRGRRGPLSRTFAWVLGLSTCSIVPVSVNGGIFDGWGHSGAPSGFQGFGLKYHPGYGYGGAALGVGHAGGYPYYGGPGYPHCEPKLNRCGKIEPFAYYGGPGYPTPGHPNYFGMTGPLAVKEPVVTSGRGRSDLDYGPFTGTLPYPDWYFAPFTAASATTGSSSGSGAPAPPAMAPNPAPSDGTDQPSASVSPVTSEFAKLPARARELGIDGTAFADSRGVRGLKVTTVASGTLAEKAGLRVGDVILSANGYLATERGHLAWIVANAASDNVLTMNVRAADGRDHAIKVPLSVEPANAVRSSQLPAVVRGPLPATR